LRPEYESDTDDDQTEVPAGLSLKKERASLRRNHRRPSDVSSEPVLVTWRPRSSIFDYSYDRKSASLSRDALEKLLQRDVKSPNAGEITILADNKDKRHEQFGCFWF
jgi:hypothetical protein